MGKKSYPRAQLRAELRSWSRRRRRGLLFLFGMWFSVAVVFVVLAMLLDRPVVTVTYAVVIVGLAIAYVALALLSFLVSHPQAMRLLRGSWGEDLTRTELTRLRRRRVSWGHVDSLAVDGGDVDHLVVLRRGGIVAIDSKWRSAWSEQICADVVLRAGKSARRARGLVATQISTSSGRHRGQVDRGEVVALAVVWGPAQEEILEDLCIDGVHVVPGRRLRSWLSARRDDVLPKEVGAGLVEALGRWDVERTRRVRRAPAREGALSPRA